MLEESQYQISPEKGLDLTNSNALSASPKDFLKTMKQSVKQYALHKWIALHMAARRNLMLENLSVTDGAFAMDFAESYTIAFKIEIQSEYWQSDQVTLLILISHRRNSQGSLISECHV